MIKRIISMALLIAVVFTLAISNADIVGNELFTPEFENQGIINPCLCKGEIYTIHNSSIILKYNEAKSAYEAVAVVEGETPRTPDEIQYSILASDGERLYRISSKELSELSIEGKKASVKKIADFKEESFMYTSKRTFINNGILYGFGWNEKTNEPGIFTFDITSKEERFLALDNIQSIGKYKDSIYASTNDGELFTLVNGKLTLLYKLDEKVVDRLRDGSYIIYDDATSAFYLIAQSYRVYKITADGKMQEFTLLPADTSYVLPDNKATLYVFEQNSNKISKVDINTAKMPSKVLSVLNFDRTDIIKKYNELHPDMPVVNEHFYGTTSNLADKMKTTKQPDVVFGEIQDGADDLIAHDFIEEIKHPELLKKLDRMYPYVKNALLKDGVCHMFPYNVHAYGHELNIKNYVYHKDSWKKLGFSENDLPKTFAEFIEFLDKHSKELSQPGIELFADMMYKNIRTDLKERLLNEAVVIAQKKGEKPSFNTPQMQKLFEMIDKAEFAGFYNPKEEHQEYVQDYEEKIALFKTTDDVIDIPNGYAAMPLSLDVNTQPINAAGMTVMMVNSLSENKEQAFDFINFVAENYEKRTQTYLYTDINEVVMNPQMLRTIQYVEKEIKKYDEKIALDTKNNGGKKVKSLQEDKASFENDLKYLKENAYLITQEELDILIKNSDNIFIQRKSPIKWDNEQIIKLMDSLYNSDSEQLTSQKFLSELDRITKMSMLEDK